MKTAGKGIAVQAAEHAERYPDQRREQDRDDGQFQRRRQACGEIMDDRLLREHADAEIALCDIDDIAPELHRQRLVEAETLAHLLQLRGRGVLAGDQRL